MREESGGFPLSFFAAYGLSLFPTCPQVKPFKAPQVQALSRSQTGMLTLTLIITCPPAGTGLGLRVTASILGARAIFLPP